MRIGEFAKLFSIEQHTVRYYIKIGLLLPESRNGQYLFDSDNVRDMEFILKFKSMGFSLEEIHEVISFYRISNFASQDDRDALLELLLHKKALLIKKSENVAEQIEKLKDGMEELRKRRNSSAMMKPISYVRTAGRKESMKLCPSSIWILK